MYRLVLFGLWVGLSSVGCNDGKGGVVAFVDEDTPATVRSFQTTAAQEQVDVPASGTVAAELLIDNGNGICLRIAAGTALRRTTGERISGPIDIGFDDGAPDVDWLEGTIGETLAGSVRVWARVPGETEMLDILFDPPAELELKALQAGSGEWRFEQYTVRPDRVTALAGAGPGEPPSGTRWELHDFGSIQNPDDIDFGSPKFPVKISTLTGAWLNDSTLPPAGFECAGTVVSSRVLGPVGGEFPKLCCLRLINPVTGQVVAANCWFPGLFFPGQSRLIGPDRDIEVRIVERDGNRVVEICSPYKNAMILRTTCCTGPEVGDGESKESVIDGSEDEQDLEGPYIGAIEVKVTHWGGFGEFLRTRDMLQTAHARTFFRWVAPLGGGRYLSCFNAYGYTGSVRAFAGLFPDSWQFRFLDRRLEITIPCPEPAIVTRASGATTIDVVDAETLQTIRTSDTLPGVADKVVVLPEDQAIVVTAEAGEFVVMPGALHRLDLATGAVLGSMSFPGLHTGIALNQYGDRLFVATADGVLRVLDAADLSELDRVEGLPTGRYDTIAVSIDGGVVYAAAPTGSGATTLSQDIGGGATGLLRVDLLHGTVGTVPGTITFTVSGVSPAPDGRVAIVVDDGVRILDNGASDPLLPPPVDPVLRWTPQNELVVGSEADVRVYTPDQIGSVSISGTSGASSIVAYVNTDGSFAIVGARPSVGELFRTVRTGPATYANPLGRAAPAILDTEAFARSP